MIVFTIIGVVVSVVATMFGAFYLLVKVDQWRHGG